LFPGTLKRVAVPVPNPLVCPRRRGHQDARAKLRSGLGTGTATLFRVPGNNHEPVARTRLTTPTLLPCGLPVLRRHPLGPSAIIGSALPPRGSTHLAVFRTLGTRLNRQCDLPWTLAPLRSFARASWCPRRRGHTHSLEVFRPLSATHPLRATNLELCLPESCCVLVLTMHLDALLPRRTLRCPSNRTRSRGVTLQSLTWQRSPTPLGGASPHAISDRPQ